MIRIKSLFTGTVENSTYTVETYFITCSKIDEFQFNDDPI